MKKFFFMIFFAIFFLSSNAHAEIKNYVGEGFFAVVDETLDVAKEKAKLDGERNISEQIAVYIESFSEVKNSQLTHDEIITITESLMKILEVKYKIEPAEDDNFIIRAIVTAEIDTDELEKILNNREEKNHE
ncbi:MAG: hypothetical protein IK062_11595 [Selenomonadaceae bacterium]|nr:hypothetical protein [Selenomonadaceae bacterium]